MSVIVKGMDMPKNCGECAFYIDAACYGKGYRDYRPIDYRTFMETVKPDNCPLVEIPTPHSDLVDRNKLLAEYDRQHKGPAGGARRIMEQAEAVIEAEGETE